MRAMRRSASLVLLGAILCALPATAAPTTAASAAASAVRLPVDAGRVRLEARPDIELSPTGVVYAIVSAEGPSSTVIAALDARGRPRQGWPIAIAGDYAGVYQGREGGVAFGTDGTLYLVVDTERGTSVTAVRPDGAVARGWPIDLGIRNGCDAILPVADGTVRVVCGLGGTSMRAFAFDGHGRALAGWPVRLTGSGSHLYPPRPVMRGTTIVGVQGGRGWVRRYAIAENGRVRYGTKVSAPTYDSPCYADRHWAPVSLLGPDGTGYLWSYTMAATGSGTCRFVSSRYVAFDDRGARPGWPVTVAGESSEPAIGPAGRLYATQGSQGRRPSRVFAFDAKGRQVAGWPVTLDVAPTLGQRGEGWWPPAPPRVGGDGTVYLVTEDRGTTVFALDRAGHVLAGWPYRSEDPLGDVSPPGSTGGGHPIVEPVIDGAGLLHIVHGASVTLVEGGRVALGWPVTLRRPDAQFVSVDVDAAGVTYAVAQEFEGTGSPMTGVKSETVLAIGLDGEVTYRTVLVEPAS